MRRMLVLAGLVVLLACAVAPSADADTVYTYTGNTFTNVSDPGHLLPPGLTELTGSLTLSGPLPTNFDGTIDPIAFSFTDGVTTISNVNGGVFLDTGFVTDTNGKLIDWVMKDWLSGAGGITEFFTNSASVGAVAMDEASYFDGSAFASIDSSGTWTVSETPEPPALSLLAIGLTALAASLWLSQPYLFSRGSRHSSISKQVANF